MNLRYVLFIFFLQLNVLLAAELPESYLSKITPRIPYKTALDFVRYGVEIADRMDNFHNCTNITSSGQQGILPVCALLPASLVQCNPIVLCPLYRYQSSVLEIKEAEEKSKQNGEQDTNVDASIARGKNISDVQNYYRSCNEQCIEKIDTGPRKYQDVKWVKVECRPLVDTCCGATSFYREVPCTKDWVGVRDCINEKTTHTVGGARSCPSDNFIYSTTSVIHWSYDLFNKSHSYNFLTTLIYSIFFGLVGCDRCCLGNRVLGVFKLVTIGGIGVWWLIDIILLIFGKHIPEDGSNWNPYY